MTELNNYYEIKKTIKMENFEDNRRYDEDQQPHQHSAYECFIIFMFVIAMAYMFIFGETQIS